MENLITSENIKYGYFKKGEVSELDGKEQKIVEIIRTFTINFPNLIDGEKSEDLKFLNYNFRGLDIDKVHSYIAGEDRMDWKGPVKYYS